MDRVFLDANVLFSAAYRREGGLMRLWQLEDVELLTSQYAIDETARNLSEIDQQQRLQELLTGVTVVDPASDFGVPNDVKLPEKDVPILAAAVLSRASHLLTGDKLHFGPLFGKVVSGVLIQPPGDYLRLR